MIDAEATVVFVNIGVFAIMSEGMVEHLGVR